MYCFNLVFVCSLNAVLSFAVMSLVPALSASIISFLAFSMFAARFLIAWMDVSASPVVELVGVGCAFGGGAAAAGTGCGATLFGGAAAAGTGSGATLFGGTAAAGTGSGATLFGGTAAAASGTGTGATLLGGTAMDAFCLASLIGTSLLFNALAVAWYVSSASSSSAATS